MPQSDRLAQRLMNSTGMTRWFGLAGFHLIGLGLPRQFHFKKES